ncbi:MULTISPECIES: hypothetical protein [Pseudoalteromonas]|uniref:Uncharacterized protein n=1 Tax=Pseudoalteromonas amylolytica TaxID=1859457 RepID=A0A1S1MT17_9GAMM|nr:MULTISPECIES: hypothetical protein [Pseudoalteromonas]MCF6436060.1 hypothetical protein [Pseudoalteromonas sp. MMG022]OHU89094.1 hypothetical protein BFC16_05455 [Pseudoalteromonas sp. JW3]OHU91994.1 hypothetical protein BET10_06560 [Pseudoalteromonas amylolytica]
MPIKYYPFLLYLEESIEFIDCEETLNHALFYLSNTQTQHALCLYDNGQCYDLQGYKKELPTLSQLTGRVQQALLDDGQCCVQKVVLTDIKQVFSLLCSG